MSLLADFVYFFSFQIERVKFTSRNLYTNRCRGWSALRPAHMLAKLEEKSLARTEEDCTTTLLNGRWRYTPAKPNNPVEEDSLLPVAGY